MSSHPCDTENEPFKAGDCSLEVHLYTKYWGMIKLPPIGGWLLIRVAAYSRFCCTCKCSGPKYILLRLG